ncbi:MAG: protein-disulfide reductase DsbD domain-containing protein, partial [Bacillota bacterium]
MIQSIKHFTTLALAALTLPALAAPVVTTEHVEAQLISERAGLQPGKPATIGVQLRLTPQWHTYWKNPGDSGLPTRIKWTLPQGWTAGDIQWPYPKPLPIGPLMNFGYEDEVVLLTDITPAANAPAGPVDIKAHVDWLVCKDICIPEQGDLDLTLPVAAKEAPVDARGKANIDNARSLLPVVAPGWKFESALSGKSLVVRLAAPGGATPPAKAQFFPEQEGLIEPAAPQKLTREGNAIRIEMKLADPVPAGVKSVNGVAVSDAGWAGASSRKAIEVAAPVGTLPPVSPAATVGTQVIGGSALVALGFAFLGGLLLNLMPCVF